jgi:NAD(P)-dependent dehydrogenase (short-subunit alcohol dehydrogenase family)/acyl dehydratase
MTTRQLRVSRADVALFARASGDVNPLHHSAEYARRTPFAEPIVHGALTLLSALSELELSPDTELASARFEFRGPVFPDGNYALELTPRPAGSSVVVRDAGRSVLEGDVSFRPRAVARTSLGGATKAGRTSAVARRLDELADLAVGGSWAPVEEEFGRLSTRYELPAEQIAVFLCASYIVGMEVPGERATFWRLALDFSERHDSASFPFEWTARVRRVDDRVGLVEVETSIGSAETMLATGSFKAFVREDTPVSDPEALRAALSNGAALRGSSAVVIGGSRGLGAALAQALVLSGCKVLLVYRRSRAEAERIKASSDGPGTMDLLEGDAADAEWCRDVLAPIVRERGLDLLVCNAAPAIRTVELVPAAVGGIAGFVGESLTLVIAPLSALLEELVSNRGTVVVISSAALESPPPEWPHYIAAKAAVEGVVNWAAARFRPVRFVVVRPPKLLTDQMNTVLGRVGASRVEPVAGALVELLAGPRRDGVELFGPDDLD